MAFLNLSRTHGRNTWIVKQQLLIYRCLRMLCLLLTLYFIPILVHTKDPETGYQTNLDWLWYLSTGLILVCYSVFLWSLYCGHCPMNHCQRSKEVDIEEEDLDEKKDPKANAVLEEFVHNSVETWSVKQVSSWLELSPALHAASTLSQQDWQVISNKFQTSHMHGPSFVMVVLDPHWLVRDLQLTVGEALQLSRIVSRFFQDGYLVRQEDRDLPQSMPRESAVTRLRDSMASTESSIYPSA